MNLGKTLNSLRKEREMTLVDLAHKSGVALATLSRMENGKMTGTLESHMKICDALGVALPELYKNLYTSKKTFEIKKDKPHADIFIHNKKFFEEVLASKISEKKMMPVFIRILKGGQTVKEQTKPGAEKFVYVLDGKIEAVVGEGKYILGKHDSLYFESNTPHYYINAGAGESSLISVVSPPIL